MAEGKEPFVSQADRPSMDIDLDKPIAELRVRELGAILGGLFGRLKVPHPKFEAGKTEIKEFFDKPFPEKAPDVVFGRAPEPDPRATGGLDQLIQLTSGLAARVDRLADQVSELEKRLKK